MNAKIALPDGAAPSPNSGPLRMLQSGDDTVDGCWKRQDEGGAQLLISWGRLHSLPLWKVPHDTAISVHDQKTDDR